MLSVSKANQLSAAPSKGMCEQDESAAMRARLASIPPIAQNALFASSAALQRVQLIQIADCERREHMVTSLSTPQRCELFLAATSAQKVLILNATTAAGHARLYAALPHSQRISLVRALSVAAVGAMLMTEQFPEEHADEALETLGLQQRQILAGLLHNAPAQQKATAPAVDGSTYMPADASTYMPPWKLEAAVQSESGQTKSEPDLSAIVMSSPEGSATDRVLGMTITMEMVLLDESIANSWTRICGAPAVRSAAEVLAVMAGPLAIPHTQLQGVPSDNLKLSQTSSVKNAEVENWFRGRPASDAAATEVGSWFRSMPADTSAGSEEWFRGMPASGADEKEIADWFRRQPAGEQVTNREAPSGLSAVEALAVGEKNNYGTQPSVSTDFSNESCNRAITTSSTLVLGSSVGPQLGAEGRLGRLCEQLDKNGDGTITRTEIIKAMRTEQQVTA